MTLASSKGSLWQGITLVVLLLVALFLLIGGIWLASLGGSYYYAITGIVLLIVSVLYWRRSSASIGLYALLLIATILWGLWESGTDFWALAPRYDVIFLLGLWLILPPASRRFSQPLQLPRFAMQVGLVGTLAVLGYAIFNDPQEVNGTLKNPFVATQNADSHSAGKDWTAYGGTPGGTRYSSLVQVNTENVDKLQEVWRFRTGDLKTDADPVEITNEVTPLKVGNTLYLCTAHQKLFALDATTGEQKWAFDPKLKSDASFQHLTCRGVSYHDSSANAAAGNGSPSLACPRKVFLPVNDGRLFAINPENGQPCEDFGEHGVVNLQANMPHNFPGGYEPTSPPVVTDKTIVMAGAVTDNFSVKEPSGVIRGYDVNNGKLLWVFDTGAEDPNAIPKAGENFTANSPNSWAPSAYDPELDLVYVPTGVQTPDIWGGNRTPNMERYATSILALNATTGKLVWSYQTVHHDLWDMDVPAQPSLVNIDQQGKVVPAIYAPTKTGNIFVLDRRTGQLIVPAPEKPVPQGPAKGDRLSPTQPFSDLSYRPTKDLTDKNMWGATTFDQLMCRISFHKLRYEGIFTPPSEQGTLVFPGNLGMFEWGGISVNQDRQVALSNPMGLPFVSKLIPRGPNNPLWPEEGAKGSGTETGIQPQYGVPFGVEIGPFLSAFGLPCKEPGWGFISALDLKTQQVIWKKRIGTIRDSLPGIQLPPLKIGVPMLGGPISTAGNLMFIAATQDNYLRAFNIENGDQLWQTRLPAGGQATPMTYEANGKQFVVIAAGGHGSFGTKMGDYIIAYALPDGAKAAD